MHPTLSRTVRRAAAAATVALLAACGGADAGSDAAGDTATAGSGFGPAVPDSAAAPGGVDSMAPRADVSADTVRDSVPPP